MNSDEQMQQLQKRLRNVEDMLEISQLLASYGPLVDSGNAEATAALWAEDGEYDVPGLRMRSRNEIRAMVLSDSHKNLIETGSAHFIGPPHVVVDGDKAVAVCESILVLREDDSYRILLSGSHNIQLQRLAGQWKITRRITRELNGDARARELLRAELS
uniref:nuclear transport factor 2 family protein n=1 Tax=Rhodococcus qingshengii TaxID=334542 RepID=UPI001C4DE1EB|nr:nuclear transport factor 2 family protein [Rhodococcus qingshengii]